MNRHKLLALAAMLLVPLAACDEGTPPVPQGTIDGQVAIEGQGIDGVTVTLNPGSSTTTANGGRFSFANVDGGTYTVTISNFPGDASFAATSQPASITSSGQTATVNFSGTFIRTASIIGSVTVERTGLSGVTVRLSGMADQSTQTDANGQYAFTQLRAGAYEIELSGFAADVGFSNTSRDVTVGVGETEAISFDGTYVRTAGIQGRVTVDGSQGLSGVTVNLTGVGPARTATTDAAGQYAFTELRAGAYQVGISGFDADDYEFSVTSQSVTVALGQTANVPFDGARLRTAGISGQVHADGDGIAEVIVSLSRGTDEAMDTTDAEGQYAFSGLAAGTYTVTISGYDATRYNFDAEQMSQTVADLDDNEARIVNFKGTHVTNASIMGYLFLDANKNGELDQDEEDTYALGRLQVALIGPGVNDMVPGRTNADGMYMFEGLRSGTYRVLVTNAALDSADVDDALKYDDRTNTVNINVEPGESKTHHLPFQIVTQTITMQAMMGNGMEGKDAVTGAMLPGVGIDFYPTYQAAEAGRQQLGEMAVTDSTGTATITFPRESDTGPGGGSDYLVFAKVAKLPHDELAVTANSILEVSYEARNYKSMAARAVQVINRRVLVKYTIRNIETALGGDEPLEGWVSEVRTEQTLNHQGALRATHSNKNGESVFNHLVKIADLPTKVYVRLADDFSDSTIAAVTGSEEFAATPEPSGSASMEKVKWGEKTSKTDTVKVPALVYENHGIALPGDTVDLGVLRVKWTTQSLYLGVHHERTDVMGYDKNRVDGDMRPDANAASAFTVQLQVRDQYGTPQDWRYPKGVTPSDRNTATERKPGTTGANAGLVIFRTLPTDTPFVVTATMSHPDRETKLYGGRERETSLEAKRPLGEHSVGAFGSAGGTRPNALICPLANEEGPSNCSTFSYGYTDGIVRGIVRGGDRDNGWVTNFGSDSITIALVRVSGLGIVPDTSLTKVGRAVRGHTVDNDEFVFTGLEGGDYELSVMKNSAWSGEFTGGTNSEKIEVVHSDRAVDSTWANDSSHIQAYFEKTSISGTVVNDLHDDSIGVGGNNQVNARETISGATVTLMRVKRARRGEDTTMVKSTKTSATGKFSFDSLREGTYVVKGTSTDSYRLVAKGGSKLTDVSPKLVTGPQSARRAVTSGDSLPYWDYATGGFGSLGAPNQRGDADADMVVLFRDGILTGTVQRPDGNDANTLADPVKGVRVWLYKCQGVPLGGINTGSMTGCDINVPGFELLDTTEADGTYRFEGLEEGVYYARIHMTDLDSIGGYDGTGRVVRTGGVINALSVLRGRDALENFPLAEIPRS